jgi:RNA polymerase sigma-70 factor (ECF subfamily)
VTGAATDEALMALYLQGDRAAFDALFSRYAPKLRQMLARRISRSDDVADIVQQTFLQLHRARKDFRADAKLRPWLYTIAMNLARQYFRRRGRRPETGLGEHEPAERGREGDPERKAVAKELRAALAELPPPQREVIELHWFEGLPFKEVAVIVGASESAVKVRAHRGYEKLRGRLADGPVTGSRSSGYGRKTR